MTSMLQKAAVQQGQQQLQKEVQSGLKGLLNNMGKKSQPPKPAPAPADTTKQPPKP
jgi:hypothetical protein